MKDNVQAENTRDNNAALIKAIELSITAPDEQLAECICIVWQIASTMDEADILECMSIAFSKERHSSI